MAGNPGHRRSSFSTAIVLTVRGLVALIAVAVLSGCGGDEEELEIRPGPLKIGIVAAPGAREEVVRRGVQVAAATINAAGGIGGAAPIELVVGDVRQLLRRDLELLVLPCDQDAARDAARRLAERRAVAVAPCDDGGVPASRHVFTSGLAPAAQAAALADVAGDRVALVPTLTERGGEVERLLTKHVRLVPGGVTAGADAPERVLPRLGSRDGTLYVTYGFPEPGNEVDEFFERYKALFARRPPSIVAALGADALSVLAAAIEEAGSPEPALVSAQLVGDGLEVGGVLGTIEFPGASFRARSEWVAVRIERGRYRVVRDG